MTHNRQKLTIPQRALQLNILPREIAAKIKAAGIAIIVDRAGPPRLRCDPRRAPEAGPRPPIPRCSTLAAARRRRTRLPAKIRPLQIDFVAQAPRQLQGIAAQSSAPAQRCLASSFPDSMSVLARFGATETRSRLDAAMPSDSHAAAAKAPQRESNFGGVRCTRIEERAPPR